MEKYKGIGLFSIAIIGAVIAVAVVVCEHNLMKYRTVSPTVHSYTFDEKFLILSNDVCGFTMETNLICESMMDSAYINEQYGYLEARIHQAFSINARTYSADSLMNNADRYKTDVIEMLNGYFGNENIYIKDYTITITPPQYLIDMVEARNQAEKDVLDANKSLKEAYASYNEVVNSIN